MGNKLQEAFDALSKQYEEAQKSLADTKRALDEQARIAKQSMDWLWGLLQGDFNEEQTTSQVITNAGISITLSATGIGIAAAWILDFRDFCACIYLIHKDGSKSGSFKFNEVMTPAVKNGEKHLVDYVRQPDGKSLGTPGQVI